MRSILISESFHFDLIETNQTFQHCVRESKILEEHIWFWHLDWLKSCAQCSDVFAILIAC